MSDNKIGNYEITGIKAFSGHEGESCLQGSLRLNGKKVADWSEDSWGGPMHFHFKSNAEEKAFREEANKHEIATKFIKEMVEEYGEKAGAGCHADLVVATIAQEIDLKKRQDAQMKRWCKNQIVFRMPGDPEGEYRTYKMIYDPAKHDEFMAKKHPGAEILNKRFL